jgi:hypothetical protein
MKTPRGDSELHRLATLVTEVIHLAGFIPFVATDEITKQGLTNPKEFMPFVKRHGETSDLMIVLYHPELRGGLIELGIAYANEMPVWLCYRSGQKVSSSASGCADLQIEFNDYEDLLQQLSVHLGRFN